MLPTTLPVPLSDLQWRSTFTPAFDSGAYWTGKIASLTFSTGHTSQRRPRSRCRAPPKGFLRTATVLFRREHCPATECVRRHVGRHAHARCRCPEAAKLLLQCRVCCPPNTGGHNQKGAQNLECHDMGVSSSLQRKECLSLAFRLLLCRVLQVSGVHWPPSDLSASAPLKSSLWTPTVCPLKDVDKRLSSGARIARRCTMADGAAKELAKRHNAKKPMSQKLSR